MSLRLAAVAALAAAALLAGCDKDKEGDALMRPGEDCLACHGEFTAAGTVYASATAGAGEGVAGATVTLVGTAGSDTVTTNAAGNFYTRVNLGFPLVSASVSRNGQTRTMQQTASVGSCAAAACHGTNRIH